MWPSSHQFTHLFTSLRVASLLKPTSAPFSPPLPQKLLSQFAKEAERLLQLREGPKHNLNTKAKTQCSNNIEDPWKRTACKTAFTLADSLPEWVGY